MKALLPLTFSVLGLLITSLILFFAAYGALTIFYSDTQLKLRPESSGDIAAWVQAVAAAVAIFASAMFALYVQRRDHRNQLRGPIEVALEIARYSQFAVRKVLQELGSPHAIVRIGEGVDHFDLEGISLMARITAELPIHELKNGDAARFMMNLSQMMRQLDSQVREALTHHRQIDAEVFLTFQTSLNQMDNAAERAIIGLRKILKET